MSNELRITGKAVYDELTSRGIEVDIIDVATGLLRFKANGVTRYVQSCLTDTSSPIGRNISDRKTIASKIAKYLGMIQPAEIIYSDDISAKRFLDKYEQLVVKPDDGAHGKGVTIGVTSINQLTSAIEYALLASRSKKAIIQQQLYGLDVRILMINGKLAGASLRTPAYITGDGKSTIAELVDKENTNPLRGKNYHKPLNFINKELVAKHLGDQFTVTIPGNGEMVQVIGTANIGTGGKATDITDDLPVDIIQQASALAAELKQGCCGVDYLTSDISNPKEYYFIEINASPSFGLHMKPSEGKPRQVQKMFVDMLLAAN